MGNYSGTIRCGHCYERGHNRAGCPKLTEELARRFEVLHQAVKDGRRASDDYTFVRTRERLAKRTGVDPVTGESKRRRRETRGGRVCGYCKENGHNRRTCPTLKSDKERFAAMTSEVRVEAMAALREHGVGVGALLNIDEYGTHIPVMVTGFKWESITRKNRWPDAVLARRLQDNKEVCLGFPSEITGSTSRWNRVTILSPSHGVTAPEGWVEAKNLNFDAVDLFEKAAQRDYWFWRDHDEEEK